MRLARGGGHPIAKQVRVARIAFVVHPALCDTASQGDLGRTQRGHGRQTHAQRNRSPRLHKRRSTLASRNAFSCTNPPTRSGARQPKPAAAPEQPVWAALPMLAVIADVGTAAKANAQAFVAYEAPGIGPRAPASIPQQPAASACARAALADCEWQAVRLSRAHAYFLHCDTCTC